jgi:type IX secretion system PorP/SprF family membrane protein
MKYWLKYIYLLFAVIIVFSGKAQDMHFSQFYSAPLQLNPALTGFFPCDWRFGLNYRSQWASVLPFKTQGVWGDGKFNKSFFQHDWFGIGGMVYNDNAGDGLMKNTKFMLNLAYHKGFFRNEMFNTSLGMSMGLVNRNADIGGMVFDSQWNGSTFSPSAGNGETIGRNSFYYFDLNVGALLTFKKSRYETYLGGSINHITKPDISFTGAQQNMAIRYIIHGGGTIHAKQITIKPQFMVSSQSRAREIIFGANFIYNYSGVDLYFGIFDRLSGNLIPTLGFDWKGWLFMFTYDVNYAPYLSSVIGIKGGWELSLIKTFGCGRNGSGGSGGNGKKRDMSCPAYN